MSGTGRLVNGKWDLVNVGRLFFVLSAAVGVLLLAAPAGADDRQRGGPAPGMDRAEPQPPAEAPPQQPQPQQQQQRVRREYQLTPPKAEALLRLLGADDVKVLIGRQPKGVFIEGTPDEAKTIDGLIEIMTRFEKSGAGDVGAFVEREKAKWDSRAVYQLPPAKIEDLFGVLQFEDVPVLVSTAAGALNVQATQADQQIVAAVVRIISGDAGQQARRRTTAERGPRHPAAPGMPGAPGAPGSPGATGHIEKLLENVAQRMRAAAEELEQRSAEIEQRMHDLQEQTQAIREEAEKLREQLSQEGQRLAKDVQEAAGDAGREVLRQISPPPGPPGAPQPPAAPVAPKAPVAPGEKVTRKYELSGPHAANLYKLLSPNDVRDVVVSRNGNVIEVQASERDQEAIAALVDILTRNRPKKD